MDGPLNETKIPTMSHIYYATFYVGSVVCEVYKFLGGPLSHSPLSHSPLYAALSMGTLSLTRGRRVDVLTCRRAAAVFWRVGELLCLSVRLVPSRPFESRTAATRYHGAELEIDGPIPAPRRK